MELVTTRHPDAAPPARRIGEPKPSDLPVGPRVLAQRDVRVDGSRVVRVQLRVLPSMPEEPPRAFVLVGNTEDLNRPSPMPLASVSFPARLVGDVRRALGAIERRAARRPDGGGRVKKSQAIDSKTRRAPSRTRCQ